MLDIKSNQQQRQSAEQFTKVSANIDRDEYTNHIK